MGVKKRLIVVNKEYAGSRDIPVLPGLILKGPYEFQIKLTKTLTSCEMMYDLLINGKVYKQIPVNLCKKLKTS